MEGQSACGRVGEKKEIGIGPNKTMRVAVNCVQLRLPSILVKCVVFVEFCRINFLNKMI